MHQLSLSRYEHRALLGQGGMGRVSLVYDPQTGREVALKEILVDGASTEEFKQEFWWMTRLRHPSLVEVYDFGTGEGGKPFFTMEVVAGQALDGLVPMAPEQARAVLTQLLRALRYVHQQGLVHGDIKADNLRLREDGSLKLLDFGLMARAGQAVSVRGTPAYMAPEMIRGGRVDQRADLYAVGCLAMLLLTGRLPFEATSTAALLKAHLEEAPLPPGRHRRELDPSWNTLVLRLLAKDPARRFASAAEVLEALGEPVEDDEGTLLVSPFVGREAELERLSALLAELPKKSPGPLQWVSGAPGLGKSRLLDELQLRAQLAGVPVLRGVAAPGAPYGPFVEMLRQAWPQLLALDELIESHGPALHTLLPDLAPLSHRLEPFEEKLRLQGAVAEVLLALSRRKGLVLLVDDWHQADSLSIELMTVLRRRLAQAPVLVTATTTSAPEGESVMALGPLKRAELAAMVGAMLGEPEVPEAFLAQVAELTGGAPYAVEALLGHLVAAGILPRERGRWTLAPLPAAALPEDLGHLIADRLADLPDLAQALLTRLGLVGQGARLELLLRLLPEHPPEAIYQALAGLEGAQLVMHQHGAYHVAQGHLAQALLHRLPAVRLQALHSELAETLEEAEAAEGPETDDALVIRLATHFLAGDRPVKAFMYACRAAQRLAALYANEAAKGMLEAGWTMRDRLPESALPLELAYLSLRGDLHRMAFEFPEAERYYERALSLAESQDDREALAHVRVGQGLVKQAMGEYDAALDRFREALPVCRGLEHAREELRCLAAMGRVYYYAGDRARSQTTYEEALARARAVGDLAYTGESLGFLGLLHVSFEAAPGLTARVDEGLDCLRQAIMIKQALGDRRGLNDSYMLLGNAQLSLGDLPEAEASFLANQAICQEIGAFEDEIFSFLNLAIVAIERGDMLTALERARKAIALAESRQSDLAVGFGACLEARALLALGQLLKPLDLLEAGLAKAREQENRYWELFTLWHLADAQLKMGRYDEAQIALLEALSAEAETGITEFSLPLQLIKAGLAMRQGNMEPAESTYREALARAQARQAQLIEAQAATGLAEVALASGAPDEAGRWADRAHDCAMAADARALVAEGHHLRGRITLALGDFIEADRHFQRAQEAAERLHLLDLLARALHDRALLQFPSPQSSKLLKRAQDLMVKQVDGLAPAMQEAFLAVDRRYSVFMGELPTTITPEPAATHEAESAGLVDARAAMAQQRVWIEELQAACGLLMKQLDFSQAMARSTDPAFVMTHALNLVLEITQGDRAELLLLDGKRLVVKAKKALGGLQRIDEDWTLYAEAVETAMETGEPVYWPVSPEVGLDEPRMVLAVPLAEEQARVGVILVLGHPENTQSLVKRELDAVRVLTNQLAATLRNIRLQNEWKEKTQRLEMLYMLSSSVTSTLVMDEVLDLVVKLSLEITQADRGFLLLLDDAGELQCRAARHPHGALDNLAAGEGYSQSICRRVLESGEALCVEDTLDDDVLRHQKSIQDLNLRTVMCVPLRVKQKYLGVLYVDSRVVVNTFTERDLDLLRSIASQASIALENARLYTLATVDGLTGLFFRSHFEQRMREEMQRAHRYGSTLALLMMDIDHFKKFNDTYGHATGDEVLRLVAGVIKASVRQDIDIPCRYGGEEMVVLLPETDEAGAMILAERVRRAVDEAVLDTIEHQGLHVTLSIGVATYPHHATTSLALMEFADQALYQSKHAGRNLVTLYSPAAGE